MSGVEERVLRGDLRSKAHEELRNAYARIAALERELEDLRDGAAMPGRDKAALEKESRKQLLQEEVRMSKSEMKRLESMLRGRNDLVRSFKKKGHFAKECRSKSKTKSNKTSDRKKKDGTANAVVDKILATGSGRKTEEWYLDTGVTKSLLKPSSRLLVDETLKWPMDGNFELLGWERQKREGTCRVTGYTNASEGANIALLMRNICGTRWDVSEQELCGGELASWDDLLNDSANHLLLRSDLHSVFDALSRDIVVGNHASRRRQAVESATPAELRRVCEDDQGVLSRVWLQIMGLRPIQDRKN
ncbi:MAG: hypothetical protein M1826_005805 [Phylliscum demangeonii]|nr:MAG: hypothetical protein M1826_005805 [Phylliscum demangeonii]